MSFSFAFEDALIIWMQQYMSAGAVSFFSFISELGDQLFIVALVGLFYWSLDKELGKKIVLNICIINIVNPCVKSLVKRLRPYMANPKIKCLKPVSTEGDLYDVTVQEYSFPSGHAANSVAVYGTIGKYYKKAWLRAMLFTVCLLIGISRFAVGVHYPTDVLLGWLLAALSLTVFGFLFKKVGRYKMFLILDALGLLGFIFARTNDFYTGYGMLLGSTLAIVFEEKRVNFKEAGSFLSGLLRTVVGGGLFLGLNALLKLPFTEEFLSGGTMGAFIVRALRYAVLMFLLLGVYPMTFRWTKEKQ